MANEEQLTILKRGAQAWRQWCETHSSIVPDLRHADLRGAKLKGAYLALADLTEADLTNADLSEALLKNAVLTKAILVNTKLVRCRLGGAHLTGALLGKADMTMAVLKGAAVKDATLTSANLTHAIVSDTNLSGSDLSGANLSHALLSRSRLDGALLCDASLTNARFDHCDLTHADLQHANMARTQFNATNLHNADLSRAICWATVFANIDLSSVVGLETLEHLGPSTIGLDTLYESQGQVPDQFLRDSGVPEDVIEHLLPLIRHGPPIQWHSCFISYSTRDEEFATRLHSRMRQADMRVWFAPEDLKGGKKLHEQLFEAIQFNDKLLLVLSPHSVQSEWVMTEIRKAREMEKKENRRKLFPIRLMDFDALNQWSCFDADTGKDLAIEVREYFIPDFSNWKNNAAFEIAFQRLQKDLKAGGLPRKTE